MTPARGTGYHSSIVRRARRFHPITPLLLAALAWAASGYTPPPLPRTDVTLQPGESCKPCHLDITEQWRRSAHARAGRGQDLLFGRMYFYSLKQTRGATMVACGPCHETASFVNQDFTFVRDVSAEGVTCSYCHSISGPGDPKGVPPYTLSLDAYHGTIRLAQGNSSHKSAYSAFFATSEFCGNCHSYENQNGVRISDTYREWKNSKYAKQGVTCQSCHMPGRAGRNSNLGPVRPNVPNHAFSVEDLAAARPNAATLALSGARRAGDSLRVTAVVTNAGWGHSLPTGNDQNLALLRVRVTDADGQVVWENDPFSEWNVSVFGLILADEVGNWPADTWNATKILSDRRIKAGGSARVTYDVPLKDAKGALTIEGHLVSRRAKPQTITAYGLDEATYGAERSLAQAKAKVP
ncbi:MAG: multiheme c-type cytochrome [Hyphomicrobiales bacterium]